MPRPRRIAGAGLIYHVYARGNNGEAIFREDVDRERYLGTLAEARSSYSCSLFAYVLMTNHAHFIVQTAEPNISKVMWYVQGNYATFLNHKYGRYGHLFAARFHSRVIQTDEYLLQCSCYIHLNPVRAGLVQRPEDFNWSSYRMYAEEATVGSLVDVTAVLGLLGTSSCQARRAYATFVTLALKHGALVLKVPPIMRVRGRGGALDGVREPTSGPYPVRRDPIS